MKVQCPKCKAVYNVNESKIPEEGATITCKKCKNKIRVEQPVEQPVEQSIEQPVEQSIEQPVEEFVEESVEQPVEEPVGQSVEEPVEESVAILKKENIKSKWYDKKALVIILLIIFFPIGIYALWKSNRFSKMSKGIITAVIAIFVIYGYLTDQEEKKQTNIQDQQKSIATNITDVTPKEKATNPLIAKIQNDPDYKEWLTIEKRTTPFQKNRKWIKETWEYMLKFNKRWQVTSDKQILARIKKTQSKYIDDESLYKIQNESLDKLKNMFKEKIFASAFFKQAVNLEVPFQRIFDLSISNGFKEYKTEKALMPAIIYWTKNYFYKAYKTEKDGKKRYIGPSILVTTDQEENVFRIFIPIGKFHKTIDWINLPKDETKLNEIFKDVINTVSANLAPWTSTFLDLIFKEKSQVIRQRLTEMSKANNAELKKMFSGEKFEGFRRWRTTFLVDDNEVRISLIGDELHLRVMKADTAKLYNIYRKFIEKI